MGALGEQYPKPLLPVANQPLIAHHLELLRGLGIREVHIVVGHGASLIMNALGDGEQFGMRLRYHAQDKQMGSAHAVARLASVIDGPFILLLGDYFFFAPGLTRMFERARACSATFMAAKREPDRQTLCEACVLDMDGEGQVRQIIEKPKVPRSDMKGCGIYICQPEFLDAVRRTPRTALRDEYELTVSLDEYLRMGYPLFAEDIIEWDTNFTRPEDVLQCNLTWLERHGQKNLIGRNVEIAAGTELEQAIIGDNSQIADPICLDHVVVFDGTRIADGGRIERALVTPHDRIAV
jgi:NDP-sugar pyrophosphorylase family protein